jgi:hypothetical protein
MTNPHVIAFKGPDDERAVSRHELLRYQAGELDEARRAAIAEALQTDEALAAELAELENDKRAFQASMPFERFASRMEAKQEATGGLLAKLKSFRLQLGGVALACGAAAALVLMPTSSTTPGTEIGNGVATGGAPDTGTIRLKGQGHIGLFVRDGGKARLGVDGEELHPGDQIQFVVRDEEQMDAMVLLGVDGKGVVTIYDARDLGGTTDKGGMSAGSSAKPRVLEQSVILDDAIGPERFFVLYGKDSPDKLKRQARRAARLLAESQADLTSVEQLDLGSLEVRQSSIHIVKTQP